MRLFDSFTKALLRSPSLRMRVLMTFYLDEGIYRFCDDFVDVTDGIYLWLGGGALGSTFDIKSGRDLSAEPVTLTLDGNHMAQAGIKDPSHVLNEIMGYLYTQRRVDTSFGFSYPDTFAVQLVIPCAALKINTCRLINQQLDWSTPEKQVESKLEITLDSLAMRYARATFRTRSQPDQQEIDPTDNFFSFTADALNTERTLYWGKAGGSSTGGANIGTGDGISRYGGGATDYSQNNFGGI